MTNVSPEPRKEWISPDGRWRWDGAQWVPNAIAQHYPPPPPPAAATPPAPPPAPVPAPAVGSQARPALPPVPPVPAWRPPKPTSGGLGHQFGGDALWSIVFGAASVFVPIVTPIYFPILPVFGLWRGVLAVRRGRTLGGAIGIAISAVGCLVSLVFSGLLDSLPT